MAINLIDTHSHINFADYPFDADQTWFEAQEKGVSKILVVGCDIDSSQRAIDFAKKHQNAYAIVGIHPHEAKNFLADKEGKDKFEEILEDSKSKKIVAIGEFGLDYFYNHSPKEDQIKLVHYQIKLARQFNLPLMLHIRDAFDDFWPIFDEYSSKSALEGVVHCFTDTNKELAQALNRGLYVALNGIMTFTKDLKQLEVAKTIPLDKLLLETDAPFLTPVPFRGKICKPEHVVYTAEFLASLRDEAFGVVSSATTKNAIKLFNLN